MLRKDLRAKLLELPQNAWLLKLTSNEERETFLHHLELEVTYALLRKSQRPSSSATNNASSHVSFMNKFELINFAENNKNAFEFIKEIATESLSHDCVECHNEYLGMYNHISQNLNPGSRGKEKQPAKFNEHIALTQQIGQGTQGVLAPSISSRSSSSISVRRRKRKSSPTPHPKPSFITRHPFIWNFTRVFVIPTIIASIIVFSGGFGAFAGASTLESMALFLIITPLLSVLAYGAIRISAARAALRRHKETRLNREEKEEEGEEEDDTETLKNLMSLTNLMSKEQALELFEVSAPSSTSSLSSTLAHSSSSTNTNASVSTTTLLANGLVKVIIDNSVENETGTVIDAVQLCYKNEKDDGKFGAIYMRKKDSQGFMLENRLIMLHKITDVYHGKQSAVLKSEKFKSEASGGCFSIADKDLHISFVAASKAERVLILEFIKSKLPQRHQIIPNSTSSSSPIPVMSSSSSSSNAVPVITIGKVEIKDEQASGKVVNRNEGETEEVILSEKGKTLRFRRPPLTINSFGIGNALAAAGNNSSANVLSSPPSMTADLDMTVSSSSSAPVTSGNAPVTSNVVILPTNLVVEATQEELTALDEQNNKKESPKAGMGS